MLIQSNYYCIGNVIDGGYVMGRESKIKKLRKEGILEPVKIDKKRASALKKIFIWTASLLLSFIFIFGSWAYFVKDIEATVNGQRVTTLQVEEMLEPILRSMEQQGIDPYSPDQAVSIRQYRQEIIEMLIDATLFEQYAKRHNITVSDELMEQKINEEIEEIKNTYEAEEEFYNTLARSELRTEERLRDEIRKALKPQLLEEAVLEPKFNEVSFTEEDALAYFEAPGTIEVQRILLEVPFETASEEEIDMIEAEIMGIREQLMNEEISFERAVERFSQDDVSKANQGQMTLQEGSPPNEPELFETAKQMNIGETSSIISTFAGFSIIRVNNIIYNKERYDEPEGAVIKSMTLQPEEEVPEFVVDEERPTGEERARGLANTIRTGRENFDTIAELYAISPEMSKEPQTVYRGQMEPEKETVIFDQLNPGEISDPIPSANTFEIIKLIEITPPRKADFHEIKDNLIEEMTMRKKGEIRHQWITEQRNNARITRSNAWARISDFFYLTFGGFFEDVGNFIRHFTVEPKTVTPGEADEMPFEFPEGMELPEGMEFPGDMDLDFGDQMDLPFVPEGTEMDPDQFQFDFEDMEELPFDADQIPVVPVEP